MKNNFFQKHLKAFQIAAAIIVFAVITIVYFHPILEGKRIKQSDIAMFKGMSKELADYRETTGETALWTNSMFGGMPAWTISVPEKSNPIQYVNQILSLGLPEPTGYVFISMLGFFLLLLVLDVGVGISALGAIAFGFTSYLYIIIGVGHNSKAAAMAYMAPVIAGILLSYKGKYLWGGILTALALALELKVNHLQITYYLLLTILIIVIAEFIHELREKKLANFLKASMVLVVAAVLSILACSVKLYANYEYGKETTRGKPVLTLESDNQTQGLERDYITQWSYGIGETWSLMIPNAKGGASAYIGKNNPALEKADSRFKDNIAQNNAYWGDQPGTSGPVYVGAIVVFLFVLGAFVVKGRLKWALLIATLLSILLSWGKNLMGFTNFFIDYIPGYSKFRAVSMTLVIAEVCMPLLGFLGLAEILKTPDGFTKNKKFFFISLGITAGLCLLFFLMPKVFFSFLSQAEAQQFGNLMNGKDGAIYQSFAEQLEKVRVAIFKKDAIRSFLFIVLAAVPILLTGKGKLKPGIAYVLLAALILIDMVPIDRRYLNEDNFISKHQFAQPFNPTTADQAILADKDLDFRVLDLTKNVFNDASTSYFHKSIGGYSGAKLRRYQDVINLYLNQEINGFGSMFKNIKTEDDLQSGFRKNKVLNMLNTKYLIINPNSQPILNSEAFGNAWCVDAIQWANTANDEYNALANTDLRHTAVIHQEFEQQLAGFQPSTEGNANIQLAEYKPNQLTYRFSADQDQLVVFSEIWTKEGWLMRLDGKEHPLLRANYLLRAALIPAGQHEITMRYEPRIWKVGRTLSLLSGLIILLSLAATIIFTIQKKKKA